MQEPSLARPIARASSSAGPSAPNPAGAFGSTQLLPKLSGAAARASSFEVERKIPSLFYVIMAASLLVAGGSLFLAHNRLGPHFSRGKGIDIAERLSMADLSHTVVKKGSGSSNHTSWFEYHTFRDATGQLPSKEVPVIASPPPPPASPPPPPPMSREERLAWNEKIKREAKELSAAAIAEMATRMLHDPILPPGGPVESIKLPDARGKPTIKGKYHVVVTNDGGLYGRWQTLSNYYWYKKAKAADPDGPMGGYTRLMHSSVPDDIMHLVPSIVVEHLPPGIDRGYGPMHRPWGFAQWLIRVHIEEEYIFMTEPDHIFLKQPPMFATPTAPAAFPFWYVNCEDPKMTPWCMKPAINPRQIKPADIPRTGNSPVIIHKDQLVAIVPLWDKIVRAIHADLKADEALGWAQEMYAFSIAAANVEGGPIRFSYHVEFMVEPPFAADLKVDTCIGVMPQPECPGKRSSPQTWRNVSIIHFTFGQDFDMHGKHTYGKVGPWHWDKRDNNAHYPKVPITPPPKGTPRPTTELVKRLDEVGLATPLWQAYMPID